MAIAVATWLLLALATTPVSAQDQPRDFGFVKVLVPPGWHVREDQREGTRAVFVTKESIEAGAAFRTGLSVNAVREIPKKTGMAPSVYAKRFVAELQQTKEHRGVSEQNVGKFVGAFGFFRSVAASGDTVVLFSMALGNDSTGSVFLVTFESPEGEWDEAWKIGEALVRSLDGDNAY